MVMIVGWGAGEAKDQGEVAPATCPNCHNQVFLHHIRSEKRISLYFVPLAQYGSNEYLACPICRHGLPLTPATRPAVDRMRAATASFRQGRVDQARYQVTVEAFWRTLGVAPSGTQLVQPAPTIPPPAAVKAPADPTSLRDQVEGLAKLHTDGVLTDEEFAAAKRKVLGI